jgi:hypothetical protein
VLNPQGCGYIHAYCLSSSEMRTIRKRRRDAKKRDFTEAAEQFAKDKERYFPEPVELLSKKAQGDLRSRILRAEELGSRNLANGNAAAERGDRAKAEEYYRRSQFWLDRYNKLTGND